MRRIVDNRYLDALLKLMMFSAIIHIIILIPCALVTGNGMLMNYFNILDLDLVFPGVENGALSQVICVVVAVAVYCAMFFTNKQES